MLVNGILERAQIEILSADPAGAANLVIGRIFLNNTDGFSKVVNTEGTRNLLVNDQKIIIGNDGTLANNVRIHRAGLSLLQFIQANDATAEGTASTNLANLSFKFEPYATVNRPANGNIGRVIWDTDLSVLLVDDGTNWVSTANGTEISKAFINLGTASDTNAIVLSSDTKANLDLLTRKAGALYYATDESKYYGDDGLNLINLGSGSGSGINYALNSDFEQNADNHVAYKDAAQELPEDGTGGSPTLSIARSTVSPLSGEGSGVISKPASNVQGEGVKILNRDFDTAEKGKICIFSIVTDATDANYNDGDLRVFFYDETNSKLIRINGEDIMGGDNPHYARVQIPIDCDNGSIIIHCAATHADAFEFKYDRVSFGPQVIQQGAIITDWEEFTPTGTWTTNTTYTGKFRRVGGNVEIQYGVSLSGAPNAASLFFDLPSGLSIDFDKLETVNDGDAEVGISGQYLNAGTARYRITGTVNDSNDTRIVARVYGSSGSTVTHTTVSNTVPFSANTGDGLQLRVMAPIQGWSSQANMSSDFGGREVSFEGRGGVATTITANVTDIPFVSVIDTSGSWSGSSFVIPESSTYSFSGMIAASASNSSNIRLYINGIANDFVYLQGANRYKKFSFDKKLKRKDVVSLRGDITFTSDNSTIAHNLNINKYSNPQTQLESETVAARYTSDSGQSIGTSFTTIKFEDLVEDTHNAYNTITGEYLINASANYDISASIETSSFTFNVNTVLEIRVAVNGVYVEGNYIRSQVTQSYVPTIGVSCPSLPLVKGDLVRIDARRTASSGNLSASNLYNTFSIKRNK